MESERVREPAGVLVLETLLGSIFDGADRQNVSLGKETPNAAIR
jgi:hypothetical protein